MQARLIPKIFAEEEGASEEKGEHARLSSFVGAIAVEDLVKTTLGPKGMDKILQSMTGHDVGKVVITNDGATILKALPVDNPAAKILIDASKTQDAEVGDGTTSVVVLAGELLREAERLVGAKIHPQTIIKGWRKSIDVCKQKIAAIARDNSADPELFRQDLVNIAKTTISSKILSAYKEKFAQLAVDAILRLKGSNNLEMIQVVKKMGGSLNDSYLEPGFILDKQIGVGQPKRMEKARVLVANTPMDTDKIKIYGARVKVDAIEKVAEIEEAEREKMKAKVDKILKSGCSVFINRQLIYNYPEQLFADRGVMAIEHADFEGVERLANVLGAEICSTFDQQARLGECELIEEVMIGESKAIRFSGVKKGEACTIVLRGASMHILDEADRSLHDALCVISQVVQEGRTVLGGGCTEMVLSEAVDELSKLTSGKEAIAIESFARALRAIPTILADNGGYDSSDLVAQLRAAHHQGKTNMGLDMTNGVIADVNELKITESYKVKLQVLVSAHEAAEVIVRVDDIIRSAPRKRQERH